MKTDKFSIFNGLSEFEQYVVRTMSLRSMLLPVQQWANDVIATENWEGVLDNYGVLIQGGCMHNYLPQYNNPVQIIDYMPELTNENAGVWAAQYREYIRQFICDTVNNFSIPYNMVGLLDGNSDYGIIWRNGLPIIHAFQYSTTKSITTIAVKPSAAMSYLKNKYGAELTDDNWTDDEMFLFWKFDYNENAKLFHIISPFMDPYMKTVSSDKIEPAQGIIKSLFDAHAKIIIMP